MLGLRGRVTLMCLLIAAPLLALLVVGQMLDHADALETAKMKVAELAQLGAARQSAIVNEATNTLRLLVTVLAVYGAVPGTCTAQLRKTADYDPQIDSLMIARADGTVVCSSRKIKPGLSLSDRTYFQQSLRAASKATAATELVISRVTGRPTVVAAFPIMSVKADEKPQGVITAVLSLGWLATLAARIPERVEHLALVIDPTSGDVLARSPQKVRLDDTTVADPLLVAAMRRLPRGGTVRISNGRLLPMIFGFAPVLVGSRHLMLAIGLSRRDVLAPANHRFRAAAAAALTVTSATVLLSWVVSTWLLLRPITALAEAANRFGAGDLSARAPTKSGIAELRSLSLAFNRMAGRLQVRNRQRALLQDELAVSEENYRLLAENASDMITRFSPDFRRVYVSPSCFDLLGYRSEELLGQTSAGIVHRDDWTLFEATLNAPLRNGQDRSRATYRAIRKDGTHLWLESSGRRLSAEAGFVMVTRDVSERRNFEEKLEATNRKLEDLALLDPLTELANRRRFEELLQTEHRRADRLGASLSLITVDVDHFKAFNDTYGHPAGDACLRALARAIGSVLRRPGDLAARIGGEEFSILLPNTDTAGARHMAELVHAAVLSLAIPHSKSHSAIVTISIGVATAGCAGEWSPDTLIKAADNALYAVKRNGRNAIQNAVV